MVSRNPDMNDVIDSGFCSEQQHTCTIYLIPTCRITRIIDTNTNKTSIIYHHGDTYAWYVHKENTILKRRSLRFNETKNTTLFLK